MRRLTRLTRFLALTALLTAACATSSQVRTIVAETNALMVAPTPDEGALNGDPAWQAGVDRIEALIAANPDERVLIAALRTRQALVLMAHGQDVLAKEAWRPVALDDLRTDRDRAFFLLQNEMLWWAKLGRSGASIASADWPTRLGPEVVVAKSEESASLESIDLEGKSTIERYEAVCHALPPTSGVRLYLEIQRANIVLRALNDAPTQDAADRDYLAAQCVRSVERLAVLFEPDEQKWLEQNLDGSELPPGAEVGGRARFLFQARTLVVETRKAASEHIPPVDIAAWQPVWLQTLLTTDPR